MNDLFSPQWIIAVIQSYGLWVVLAVAMLESTDRPLPDETVSAAAAVMPVPRPRWASRR